MDTFLLDLLQAVKPPKSKPMRNQTINNNFDIIEAKLNNPMFVEKPNSSSNSPLAGTLKANKSTSLASFSSSYKKTNTLIQHFITPFESFMFLSKTQFFVPFFISTIFFTTWNMLSSHSSLQVA